MLIHSNLDLPDLDLTAPRFTGRISFPQPIDFSAKFTSIYRHLDLSGCWASPEVPGKSRFDCISNTIS